MYRFNKNHTTGTAAVLCGGEAPNCVYCEARAERGRGDLGLFVYVFLIPHLLLINQYILIKAFHINKQFPFELQGSRKQAVDQAVVSVH